MSAEKIRNKSVEELQNQLVKLKEELFRLRFQMAINQLDNPSTISSVRKEIARVKTVIREIELNGKPNDSKHTYVEEEEKPKKRTRKPKAAATEAPAEEAAPTEEKPKPKRTRKPKAEAAEATPAKETEE